MHKRVFILGSTGSIGVNSIEVLNHLSKTCKSHTFEVVGISAGSNAELLKRQAEKLSVTAIAISFGKVQYKQVCASPVELLERFAKPGDLVIAAIVGFAGILPVLTAIEIGCDIALANKESLVAAGHLIMSNAAAAKVEIIPIDSEHSAIYQAIQGNKIANVKKVILTASGGSLRALPIEALRSATVEQVLNHPTWDMGQKVTVDSASLMNKSLELIEAHWLFGLPEDRLDAVIHPQSIIHGMIEFEDGSTLAQLSPPDMKFPIQYALTHPSRAQAPHPTLHWAEAQQLTFEPIDPIRYPAISLAREVITLGGTAGTVLNAANEVAVEAFLNHEIDFFNMQLIVQKMVEQSTFEQSPTIEVITLCDAEVRMKTTELISATSTLERTT